MARVMTSGMVKTLKDDDFFFIKKSEIGNPQPSPKVLFYIK